MKSDTGMNNKVGRWRIVVRVFGSLALALALLPSCRTDFGAVRTDAERSYLVQNPDHIPSLQEFRLGWPSSPLLRLYHNKTLLTNNQQGVQFESTSGFFVGFFTWSTATLILGIVLLKATRRQRATRS